MPFDRKFEITDATSGAAFTARVFTRAEAAELAGMAEDGALKIRLTAASAGDPTANQELVTFLAGQLQVDPSRIEIVAGQNGREKLITVTGISTGDIEARLGELGLR